MTGSPADAHPFRPAHAWPRLVFPLLALLFSACATRPPAPDFGRAVQALGDAGHIIETVPFYPAVEDDPYAAALAMAADYWESPRWWTRLRPGWRARRVESARTDGQFEAWLDARGLWGHWSDGDLDTVRARVRTGTPVLMVLQERPLDPATLYAALAVGFDDRRDVLLLYGAGLAPLEMSYAEVLNDWRRARYRMLTACPPERAAWRLSVEERISRGRFQMAHERYEAAGADFAEALERDPGVARHYVELADVFLYRAQYEEAERLYRAALALDELDARALNNLAFTLMQSGADLAEAIRLARNAVALEPNNPRLLDTLGVALYRAGEYTEAARVLQRARTRAMQMDAQLQAAIALHLVRVYHDDGIWHLARQTLADALAHDPQLTVPEEIRVHIRPDAAAGGRRRAR